jgi:hypothetical protein
MPLTNTEKGKIAEMLVAVAAVVQSNGRLRIGLPLVDDEGVDLYVTHKQTRRTLFLQIKSAFGLTARGEFRADVRKNTLGFDHRKLLVLVYYDVTEARLGPTLWIVPVRTFRHKLRRQKRTRKKYLFASKFNAPHDMWRQFRLSSANLAERLLSYYNQI